VTFPFGNVSWQRTSKIFLPILTILLRIFLQCQLSDSLRLEHEALKRSEVVCSQRNDLTDVNRIFLCDIGDLAGLLYLPLSPSRNGTDDCREMPRGNSRIYRD